MNTISKKFTNSFILTKISNQGIQIHSGGNSVEIKISFATLFLLLMFLNKNLNLVNLL